MYPGDELSVTAPRHVVHICKVRESTSVRVGTFPYMGVVRVQLHNIKKLCEVHGI